MVKEKNITITKEYSLTDRSSVTHGNYEAIQIKKTQTPDNFILNTKHNPYHGLTLQPKAGHIILSSLCNAEQQELS